MKSSKQNLCVSGRIGSLLLIFLVMGQGTTSFAQKDKTYTDPEVRMQWYSQHEAMKQGSLFQNLKWQHLGPLNTSGRITNAAAIGPKGKSYTIFVGAASGGVWKTDNEGTTWKPVFEHAASTSIGDVTIAASDPQTVWIGTGEANIFRSSMAGAGVYKSTDAGETWQHMGLTGTHTIPRIVIHPENPDIVYVAASGHEWTDNPERGVYKTTDGGITWNKVLFIDEETGVIDLLMDPVDSNTLYASTWQRIRNKWNDPRNHADTSNSGIHKSTDGGETWTAINEGLPEPRFRGRIGIDLCLTQPNTIYAFVDNYEIARENDDSDETDSYGRPKGGVIKGATVFRSDNHGETWRQVSESNDYMERLSATYGWVFGQIRVDPNDPDKIFVMGLSLNMSDDGGKTFRRLPAGGGDHHGLWVDPSNSNYILNWYDQGLSISYDGGTTFKTMREGLNVVQFFNVGFDMDEPFHVYGSIQDHGSRRGVVDLGNGRGNIRATDWERAPGGEGSNHMVDPTDPNIVYSCGFYGSLSRTNLATDERKSIVPRPPEGELPYRGQWLAPFIISPHNPRVIYHGMNYLFRSLDRGDSWERISDDLTHNDPAKLGDISYQTLFSISESPLKFGLIYTGTDDGRVHVTKDSGTTWREINKEIPPGKFITELVASKYDLATVYMSQNGKREDDFAPYVWKSTNYGNDWVDISGNIPCGPVNTIREDPVNKDVLYVGTDLGVYVTLDGGASWHVLASDLPTTFVHDLIIHPRDNIMVAATHGRGMFALDVSRIQRLTPELMAKDLYMYELQDISLPSGRFGRPQPLNIAYYLGSAQAAKIVIKNADGETVKELEGTGDAGLNAARWDLTKGSGEDISRRRRNYVPPGVYTIELQAGELTEIRSFEVKR